jgi:pyruvate formate lyase activating enzyme
MLGKIHSIESFGTVDGPGVRFVVFFKGCPMRCLYCHNPDTWSMDGATEMSVDEIFALFNKNREFYKSGGITATGGEPMLQLGFLTELFKRAKSEGVHTCLDTSGIAYREENIADIDELIKYTDLVMLDIKHIDPDKHMRLCAQPNSGILSFAQYLDKKGVQMWIRHVVVPGYTDDEESLYRLGQFIGGLNTVKALDILPYHDMGKVKYERLNMDYPLKDVEPLSVDAAAEARAVVIRGIKAARQELGK